MTPTLFVFVACIAIDGDTLRSGDERIRLARIDTPEKHEVGYHEAKDAMQLLIQGREVRCIVNRREKYGRLLGECGTQETKSLSDEMLRRGLALPYQGKR